MLARPRRVNQWFPPRCDLSHRRKYEPESDFPQRKPLPSIFTRSNEAPREGPRPTVAACRPGPLTRRRSVDILSLLRFHLSPFSGHFVANFVETNRLRVAWSLTKCRGKCWEGNAAQSERQSGWILNTERQSGRQSEEQSRQGP